MSISMAVGQAAGTAASLAAISVGDAAVRDVSTKYLCSILVDKGGLVA